MDILCVVNELGPAFGYFLNASNSHVLVKAHLHEGQETFEGTHLQIVAGDKEYLSGSVGNRQFVRDYSTSHMQEWITNVEVLSEIALCHPQAALTVVTHGLVSKWTYLMRVSSGSVTVLL